MEMHNKLDEEIRRKLENLEAEPSAKVWMNIRSEMAGGKSRGGFFIWGMAAAAAVLLLFVGYFSLRTENNDPGFRFAEVFNFRMKDSDPSAPLKNSTPALIEEKNGKPVPQNQLADKPLIKKPSSEKPSLFEEDKIQQENDQEPPVFMEPEIKNPIAVDEPKDSVQEEMIEEQELLKAPIDNPVAESSGQGSRHKKTSNPFKLIAKAGKELLGMDVNYKEDKNENYKFHADLGFMKIDRSGGK